MTGGPVIVLKFGSSVLPSEDALPRAVHEVYREWRAGRPVVAVVSALGKTTDRLLAQAGTFGPDPDPGSVAALAATGEAAAAALLGLALDRAGILSEVLDAAALGLQVRGPVLDAEPAAFDASGIEAALRRVPVVVVPGFVGRTGCGRLALLGRGGSDLTALIIAASLGRASCRLIKDVDGLFDRDPAAGGRAALRYSSITFRDALGLDARVVQPKALRFAEARDLRFEVAAIRSPGGTLVGAPESRLEAAAAPTPPLRIGLLGCGTVGGGVLAHIRAQPRGFEVTAVAVRDPARHRAAGVPSRLLVTDPWSVLDTPCDVVVETLGGDEPAAALLEAALMGGRHAVTANKRVVARHGPRFEALARSQGVMFLAGAAAGGAVPMIETVRDAAASGSIRSFEGILNATANFVLDRLAAGATLDDAVAEARRRGLAEADPRDDLDGTDTGRKLAVLARAAFGRAPDSGEIVVRGLDEGDAAGIRAAADAGLSVRLVARCERTADGLDATVRLESLPAEHRLAAVAGDGNSLIMTPADGPLRIVTGRGAGRWPTAEAVLGDVFEIARSAARRAPDLTGATLS